MPTTLVYTSNDIVKEYIFPNGLPDTKSNLKIAIVGGHSHDEVATKTFGYTITYASFLDYSDTLKTLIDECDIVFCITADLWHDVAEFIKAHDAKNVYWCIPGVLHFPTHNPTLRWMSWWHVAEHNYTQKETYDEISNYRNSDNPKYWYMCLLGGRRDHKTALCNELLKLKPEINRYMIYVDNDYTSTNNTESADTIPDELISHNGNVMTWLEYKGVTSLLSLFIVVDLVKESVIEVFSESRFSDNFAFISERIAKTFISRKPWLGLMLPGSLEFILSLGFKLDSQIDYSYLDHKDYQMQAQGLAKELERLYNTGFVPDQSVLDYNFNLALNTNWRQDLQKQIVKVIQSYDNNERHPAGI